MRLLCFLACLSLVHCTLESTLAALEARAHHRSRVSPEQFTTGFLVKFQEGGTAGFLSRVAKLVDDDPDSLFIDTVDDLGQTTASLHVDQFSDAWEDVSQSTSCVGFSGMRAGTWEPFNFTLCDPGPSTSTDTTTTKSDSSSVSSSDSSSDSTDDGSPEVSGEIVSNTGNVFTILTHLGLWEEKVIQDFSDSLVASFPRKYSDVESVPVFDDEEKIVGYRYSVTVNPSVDTPAIYSRSSLQTFASTVQAEIRDFTKTKLPLLTPEIRFTSLSLPQVTPGMLQALQAAAQPQPDPMSDNDDVTDDEEPQPEQEKQSLELIEDGSEVGRHALRHHQKHDRNKLFKGYHRHRHRHRRHQAKEEAVDTDRFAEDRGIEDRYGLVGSKSTLMGGVRIGNSANGNIGGTLGGILVGCDDDLYVMTNHHVLSEAVGKPVCQPSNGVINLGWLLSAPKKVTRLQFTAGAPGKGKITATIPDHNFGTNDDGSGAPFVPDQVTFQNAPGGYPAGPFDVLDVPNKDTVVVGWVAGGPFAVQNTADAAPAVSATVGGPTGSLQANTCNEIGVMSVSDEVNIAGQQGARAMSTDYGIASINYAKRPFVRCGQNLGIGAVTGVALAGPGDRVQKVGARTSKTRGKIVDVVNTAKPGFDPIRVYTIYGEQMPAFEDQILAPPMAAPLQDLKSPASEPTFAQGIRDEIRQLVRSIFAWRTKHRLKPIAAPANSVTCASVAKVTTKLTHYFPAGRTVSITGVTPADYNVQLTPIALTGLGNQFTAPLATCLPLGTVARWSTAQATLMIPLVSLTVNGDRTTANVVLGVTHGLRNGDKIYLSGVPNWLSSYPVSNVGAAGGMGFTITFASHWLSLFSSGPGAVAVPGGFMNKAVELTSIESTQSLISVTTNGAHTFQNNNRVKLLGITPPGFNVEGQIALTGANTFDIPAASPPGAAQGIARMNAVFRTEIANVRTLTCSSVRVRFPVNGAPPGFGEGAFVNVAAGPYGGDRQRVLEVVGQDVFYRLTGCPMAPAVVGTITDVGVEVEKIELSGQTLILTTRANHGWAAPSNVDLSGTNYDWLNVNGLAVQAGTQNNVVVINIPGYTILWAYTKGWLFNPKAADGATMILTQTLPIALNSGVNVVGLDQAEATMTTPKAHGLKAGNRIAVKNAVEPEYNIPVEGVLPISVVSVNTFVYRMSGNYPPAAAVATGNDITLVVVRDPIEITGFVKIAGNTQGRISLARAAEGSVGDFVEIYGGDGTAGAIGWEGIFPIVQVQWILARRVTIQLSGNPALAPVAGRQAMRLYQMALMNCVWTAPNIMRCPQGTADGWANGDEVVFHPNPGQLAAVLDPRDGWFDLPPAWQQPDPNFRWTVRAITNVQANTFDLVGAGFANPAPSPNNFQAWILPVYTEAEVDTTIQHIHGRGMMTQFTAAGDSGSWIMRRNTAVGLHAQGGWEHTLDQYERLFIYGQEWGRYRAYTHSFALADQLREANAKLVTQGTPFELKVCTTETYPEPGLIFNRCRVKGTGCAPTVWCERNGDSCRRRQDFPPAPSGYYPSRFART